MTATILDQAHAAMSATPEDDAARLRFFERLGDSELFLLLQEEAEGDQISPEIFDIGDQSVVLLFDREERLAEFVGRPAPYAALSGRAAVGLLNEAELGLALNPEVAPSAFVLAAEGVAWLAQTLSNTPEQVIEEIAELLAPNVPESLVTALDMKLAAMVGQARCAYLAGTRDLNGAPGHVLAFVDALPGAEHAIAQAVGEALTFSGLDAGTLHVGFFDSSENVSGRLARVGLRFDVPQPEVADNAQTAPGMDPDQPPILK